MLIFLLTTPHFIKTVQIGEINDEMLIDFFTIVFWSKQNKLPIDFNKSTYMILGVKRRLEDTFELLLNIGKGF